MPLGASVAGWSATIAALAHLREWPYPVVSDHAFRGAGGQQAGTNQSGNQSGGRA